MVYDDFGIGYRDFLRFLLRGVAGVVVVGGEGSWRVVVGDLELVCGPFVLAEILGCFV